MLNITKDDITRVFVYGLIIYFSVAVLHRLSPKPDLSPHGIALPAKQTLPPSNAEDVRLFPFPPERYVKVGTVNIEQHFAKAPTKTPQEIENYAKTLAASLGANAVIITTFGHTPADAQGPAAGLYIFRGIAAHIDEIS